MKEYLLIFRNTLQSELEFSRRSPEEMQAELAKWGVWMGSLAKNGHLVGGQPLLPMGKVLHGTAKKITDGPFMESKDIVGGYVSVKATDLDTALSLAKECPALHHETATVEVREVSQIQA